MQMTENGYSQLSERMRATMKLLAGQIPRIPAMIAAFCLFLTGALTAPAPAFSTSAVTPASLTIEARTSLTTGLVKAGEFTFQLYEGGTLLQTKTNAAPETGSTEGRILFDQIVYTAAGTHTYTIREVVPENAVNAYGTRWADADQNTRETSGGFSLGGLIYAVEGAEAEVIVNVTQSGNSFIAEITSSPKIPEFKNAHLPGSLKIINNAHLASSEYIDYHVASGDPAYPGYMQLGMSLKNSAGKPVSGSFSINFYKKNGDSGKVYSNNGEVWVRQYFSDNGYTEPIPIPSSWTAVISGLPADSTFVVDTNSLGTTKYEPVLEPGSGTIEAGQTTVLTITDKRIEYSIVYSIGSDAKLQTDRNSYTWSATEAFSLADVVPNRRSHLFQGWYRKSDLTGDALTEIPKGTAEDITLYTKWKKVDLEPTPEASFTADGWDTGFLSGLTPGAAYTLTGANPKSFTAKGTTQALTEVAPGTLQLVKSGDLDLTADSDPQSLAVERAAAPELTAVQPAAINGKGSIPTTAAHQFSTDGVTWTDCAGATENLAPGTFYVRTKAAGIALASEAQTIVISAFVPEKEDELQKTEILGLSELPESLKEVFGSLEKMKQDMMLKLTVNGMPAAEGQVSFYDIVLYVSLDGGVTWEKATAENFPAEGLKITLDYPEGTNGKDFDFALSHAFTMTIPRLGTELGKIETPKVTETDTGLEATLKGLSPVALAWFKSGDAPTPTSTPAPTDAPTVVPKTGDGAAPMLWLLLAVVGLIGILSLKKRITRGRF